MLRLRYLRMSYLQPTRLFLELVLYLQAFSCHWLAPISWALSFFLLRAWGLRPRLYSVTCFAGSRPNLRKILTYS
jgi:hypothetical protein